MKSEILDTTPEDDFSLEWEEEGVSRDQKIKSGLSFNEQQGLVSAYQQRNKEIARTGNEFLKAFEPLIVTVYNRYFSRFKTEREDLIQEGSLGLLVAADKYTEGSSMLFSYFAAFFVWQKMTKWIEGKTHMIHISRTDIDDLARMKRAERRLGNDLDIMQHMGIKKERLEYLINLEEILTITSLEYLADKRMSDSHMDEMTKKPDTYHEGEGIDHISDIEEELFLNETIQVALQTKTLTPNEKKVLEMRLFLRDQNNRPVTFTEIGSMLGVEGSWVSRLWENALTKVHDSFLLAETKQSLPTTDAILENVKNLDVELKVFFQKIGATAMPILRGRLKNGGFLDQRIHTVRDLVTALRNDPELLEKIHGVGSGTVQEVVAQLNKMGIHADRGTSYGGKPNNKVIIE